MIHFTRKQFKLFQVEMRMLLALSAPILIAQLSHQALSFTDTVMAGRVSTVDLAGVAVGGSLWGPLFLFLYGVMVAVTPMVAQLHGAGKTDETGPLARRGIIVVLPLVLISMCLLRNADVVFSRMGVDPQIAIVSTEYLKAISWGLPALGIFFLLRNLSEGLGLVRPSMIIGLLSIPVNMVGNYIFIHGKFGLPAMGGVGCGWASTLSLWFMCGCIILTIWRMRRYGATHFFDLSKRRGSEGATQIVRLGLPIGLSLLVEASIFALIALFLAPLGSLAVASHQITLNYSSLIFMIPLSISSAITIRVGHAIGRGRLDRARLVSTTGMALNSSIALITAILTLFFSAEIATIYTRDPQVISIVVGLLYLNALYQFPDAIQVGAAAALRGYKDARIPLIMIVFSYWVIGLPLGYSLGLTDFWGVPMGAKGFWISLIIGLSVAAMLLGVRLLKVSRREDRLY